MNKAEQALAEANAIMGQFVPLVAIVGVGVRATIALLKANGLADAAAEFEAEIAKYDAQRAELDTAITAFKAKYPSA